MFSLIKLSDSSWLKWGKDKTIVMVEALMEKLDELIFENLIRVRISIKLFKGTL